VRTIIQREGRALPVATQFPNFLSPLVVFETLPTFLEMRMLSRSPSTYSVARGGAFHAAQIQEIGGVHSPPFHRAGSCVLPNKASLVLGK